MRNSFGVPTVGGEIRFNKSYNGNCLVNAFAAGLVDHNMIFYSAASGVGMPVVYLGAKTGGMVSAGQQWPLLNLTTQLKKKTYRSSGRSFYREKTSGSLFGTNEDRCSCINSRYGCCRVNMFCGKMGDKET